MNFISKLISVFIYFVLSINSLHALMIDEVYNRIEKNANEKKDVKAFEENGYSVYNNFIMLSEIGTPGTYDYYKYEGTIVNMDSCAKPFAVTKDYKWQKIKDRNIGHISYGNFTKDNLEEINKFNTHDSSYYLYDMNNKFINEYIDGIKSWEEYEKRKQLILEVYCNIKPSKYLIKSIDKFSEKLELGKEINLVDFQYKLLEENNLFKKYKINYNDSEIFETEILVITDKNNIVFLVQKETKEFNSVYSYNVFSSNIVSAIKEKYKYSLVREKNDIRQIEDSENEPYAHKIFNSFDKRYSIEINPLKNSKFTINYIYMPIYENLKNKHQSYIEATKNKEIKNIENDKQQKLKFLKQEL